MGKKLLLYTFIAVGGYLAIANATGFGKVISAAGNTYNSGVRTLQGR